MAPINNGLQGIIVQSIHVTSRPRWATYTVAVLAALAAAVLLGLYIQLLRDSVERGARLRYSQSSVPASEAPRNSASR